jgi:hypothetical protein
VFRTDSLLRQNSQAWNTSTLTGCRSPTRARAAGRPWSCCTVRRATAARGSGWSRTSHETTPSSRGTRRVSASRRTSMTAGERPSSPTLLRSSWPRSASSGRTSWVTRSGRWSLCPLFRRHPAVPASLVLVGGYAGWAGSLTPDEVARRLEMFVGMAELGDAFDPKSYPGLFSDLIPADRDAALATMMRENIRPATIRAAGHIGAETDLRSGMARPMLGRRSRTPRPSMPRSRHRSSLCFRSSATRVWSRTPKRARRRSAGS